VTVTDALLDELHVTDASCWVLLSLNVPVAISFTLLPTGMTLFAGVAAMDNNAGGVRVVGPNNSAFASTPELS
jgi:hypothetical protein